MHSNDQKSILLEHFTLGVIASLEKRAGITEVVLDTKGPADTAAISFWEQTHCCSLPLDLKQFYLTSNGFLLSWKVKLKDDLIPIGRMEINPIANVEKITASAVTAGTALISDVDPSVEEDPDSHIPHFDNRSRIFEIDPCRDLGKVCLVYRNTKEGVPARTAEYWFLDKALRWHFIADSFLPYYRLMLTHLGLPQWQYTFTDVGVTPTVRQWYYLYAPSLLETDCNAAVRESPSEVLNLLDVARVFKGKEKKKPANPLANSSNPTKKKPGSPTTDTQRNLGFPRVNQNRGSSSAIQKSNPNTVNR